MLAFCEAPHHETQVAPWHDVMFSSVVLFGQEISSRQIDVFNPHIFTMRPSVIGDIIMVDSIV
jgi:hypothetical protein